MIYDRMEHLPRYKGLNANLDLLIDRLDGGAWLSLPSGRTDVAGDRAYITRQTVFLKESQPLYEMHRCYGDLHIALTPGETIDCLPAESIPWPEEGGDNPLAPAVPGTALNMAAGCFAIFFAWDAHRPSQGGGTCEKLVGKFLMEVDAHDA